MINIRVLTIADNVHSLSVIDNRIGDGLPILYAIDSRTVSRIRLVILHDLDGLDSHLWTVIGCPFNFD